jgi:hypothetical protein
VDVSLYGIENRNTDWEFQIGRQSIADALQVRALMDFGEWLQVFINDRQTLDVDRGWRRAHLDMHQTQRCAGTPRNITRDGQRILAQERAVQWDKD